MAAKKLPSYRRLGNVVSGRRYLTTKQLASLMGVSQSYVRRLLRQRNKYIPAAKQGRNWIITYDMGSTTKSLAVELGLSESYTRRLLSKGIIQGGVKVGRNWIYPYHGQPEDLYKRKRQQKSIGGRKK